MGKPLLIVDQNEIVKNVVARMKIAIEAKNKKIEEINDEHRKVMIAFWADIEAEMDLLGLIEKDKDGEYPDMEINKEQIISLREKDEDEHPLKKLKEMLDRTIN